MKRSEKPQSCTDMNRNGKGARSNVPFKKPKPSDGPPKESDAEIADTRKKRLRPYES